MDLRKKIVESVKKGVPLRVRPPDASESIALRSSVTASNLTNAAPYSPGRLQARDRS